jgi:hypothetical protein
VTSARGKRFCEAGFFGATRLRHRLIDGISSDVRVSISLYYRGALLATSTPI